MKDSKEIRGKEKSEIESMLMGLRREQFNLQMQKGSGQLSRPDRVKSVRREIARVKTILNEIKRTES